MNNNKLSQWLAIWQIPGLGPQKFQLLEKAYPNFQDIQSATPAELRALGCSEYLCQQLHNLNWRQVELTLRWQECNAHSIITWQDTSYPSLLRQIASAPPILYVSGNADALNQPQIAIVGSRNPSHHGLENAFNLANELAKYGCIVTSGLARGIDLAAHRGALAAQSATIAVLGSGVDIIYPRSHTALAQFIEQNGAVISEFPLGTAPQAKHFPRRNRIVSGLSLGVLVVEAALKSGSLITARYAAEQGREVFAVPGSIQNPFTKGCHALIRQGAKLVETGMDILEELPSILEFLCTATKASKPIEQIKTLDKEAEILIECMGGEVTSIDALIIRSGLAPEEVLPKLQNLELQGIVLAVPGGYICTTRF